MKSQYLLPIAVAGLSLLAGLLVFRFTLYEPEILSASPGQKPTTIELGFEDIVLDDLDGRPQALSQWQAPVLVINFWATWCAPCRREIPALIALQHQYSGQLQLIGLAFDSPQNLQAFIGEFDFNYPLLLVQTESAQLNRYFGNSHSGLPFTVVLNADRDIVYRHAGEISKQQLEQAIVPLLDPPKAS